MGVPPLYQNIRLAWNDRTVLLQASFANVGQQKKYVKKFGEGSREIKMFEMFAGRLVLLLSLRVVVVSWSCMALIG